MKVKYKKADDVTVNGNLLTRGIVSGVVIMAVTGGVVWGGYELFWVAKSNSTNRTAQITRESVGFQQGRVDAIDSELNDIGNLDIAMAEETDPATLAAYKAQKTAADELVCNNWNELTTTYQGALSLDQQQELAKLCAAPANQ